MALAYDHGPLCFILVTWFVTWYYSKLPIGENGDEGCKTQLHTEMASEILIRQSYDLGCSMAVAQSWGFTRVGSGANE